MARYQLVHNGDIKEYYSDESEWTAYECVGCGGTPPGAGPFVLKSWTEIKHAKGCKMPKKWAKQHSDYCKEIDAERRAINKIKAAGLTKLELKALKSRYGISEI
jgi:hypothetical protein